MATIGVAADGEEEAETEAEDDEGEEAEVVGKRLIAPLSRKPACRPQRRMTCACCGEAVRTCSIYKQCQHFACSKTRQT